IIALYKEHRSLLHGGRTLRLEAEPGGVAFMVVGGAGALVSYARLETMRHAGLAPLRLAGLDPEARYRIRLMTPARDPPLGSGTATGRLLEVMGLPLPLLGPGGMAVFHLERV